MRSFLSLAFLLLVSAAVWGHDHGHAHEHHGHSHDEDPKFRWSREANMVRDWVGASELAGNRMYLVASKFPLCSPSPKQEDEIIEEADIREEDIIDVPPVHSPHKPSKQGFKDNFTHMLGIYGLAFIQNPVLMATLMITSTATATTITITGTATGLLSGNRPRRRERRTGRGCTRSGMMMRTTMEEEEEGKKDEEAVFVAYFVLLLDV